jgi:acyl-homoserine lactone synthase
MLKVVTSQNADDYPELMDAVWRFRHAQFVDRLGWKELQSADGREIDRFDTDDAIHLIAAQKGRVVGYTRLLRTSGPHLLSDVYPEIMEGQDWPREPAIYEWTRCISDEAADRFGSVQASHLLITGVLEFCIVAGIKGMIVETHPKLVTWMLETGYHVDTLHTPQVINNVPVVPVYIAATMNALNRHHAMFGIRASVLDIDQGLMNPVHGLGELQHLPGLGAGSDQMAAPAPDVDFGAMRESSGKGSH